MSDSERNSFGGRVARYARVTSSMSGLAARVAGERYLGWKVDRAKHATELKDALGGLRGPLVKVAQMLATIPEALPKEYVQELQQLQSNAPPMGWSFVKRRMQSELGKDWPDRFAEFEREAAAAASLGQVHKAIGHDGTRLACKLQYPDMASIVDADLRQLRIILSLFERYDSAIATGQIHEEIGARLREELDYDLEARHCQLYEDILKDEHRVHVPEVVPDLSTKRLLTSTWLDGAPLMSCIDGPVEERNEVAMAMFRAWYVPLYYYGVIHGDPHLGNYSVRPDQSINLLDFGCVRVFPPRFVKGVIDLYNALRDDDEALAVHAYETWGFGNLSKDMVKVLNIWAGFIYGPILDDRVRPIGSTDHGVYGREKATEVHKLLRDVGTVTVPREFVFMDRAAIGLGAVYLHLRAELNYHQLFEEEIARFDIDALAARQNAALARAGLEPMPA